MHLPSEVVHPITAGAGFVVSGAAVAWAGWRIRKSAPPRVIPLIAVLSSFVFAAQMVNFPIGVSSGHLGGGVLLTALLGPEAAVLGMSAVLTIQCLVFLDGGLLALGLNIFNMGLVPPLVYTLASKIVLRSGSDERRGRIVASIISAYLAVLIGAVLVPFEVSYSKVSMPFTLFLAWMAGVHALIGIGEAVITGGVVAVLLKTKPEAFVPGDRQLRLAPVVAAMLGAALFVGFVLSNFASSLPDGLETSLEKASLATSSEPSVESHGADSQPSLPTAIMPDYSVPGIEQPFLSTGIAGFVGTLITFAAAFVFLKMVAAGRSAPGSPNSSAPAA